MKALFLCAALLASAVIPADGNSPHASYCDIHMCKQGAPNQIGWASYYGRERQGHLMANGERFDWRKLTMACWWYPFGTRVRVTNLENGKTVTVTVTDRGPAHKLHRIADLSEQAAYLLGYTHQGVTKIYMQPLWNQQIFFNDEGERE